MSEQQLASQGHVFFTKHPILDVGRKLWGYQLHGAGEGAGSQLVNAAKDQAAESLVSSTFIGIQQAMERGKRILVGFDERGVLEKAPYAFSPSQGVVKFAGRVEDPASLLEALVALKRDGYTLAVDCAADGAARPSIHALADILTVDISTGADPLALLREKRERVPQFLAERVQNLKQYETLKKAGFTLFQGAFFKQPEIIAERKLTSHEISRINILRIIEAEDPDFDALSEAIGSDVSVSFRLLSYLNSAAFGFPRKIASIKQAVMMLGVTKMKNWLRAVLLADMAQKGDNPQELVLLSLQRGKFLETVAREYDFWGFDPGALFLLGLFSLIDAILGMPTRQVVDYLPLDEKLKSALCREPNNEYQPLINLLDTIEDADWPKVEAQARKLSFDIEVVKAAYTEAMTWAGAFFESQAKKD